MKRLNRIQELMFEFDEIEEITDVGYCECVDINVEEDHSFMLANGMLSHNSASSGLSACLGRKGFGYYAMRGLPINAYSQSMQKISANQEFKDVMNILGLDVTKTTEKQSLSYDTVVVSTDADCYIGSTLVQTSEGLRPIEEINVGDRVLGSDGEYHNVVNTVVKCTGVIIRITAGGGKLLTSETQSIIVCRDGKYAEVAAQDVKTTDFLYTKDGRLLQVEEVEELDSIFDCWVLYDITLEEDHKFYIKLDGSDEVILAHNCDGSHITSMIVGWFKRFAPWMFDAGKICKLVTPLILVKDAKGKITDYFFTLAEFKEWETKKAGKAKGNIQYLKGLGSWEREDLQYLIDKDGIKRFIKALRFDEASDRVVEEWLGDDTEPRKKYLRECNFDINKA